MKIPMGIKPRYNEVIVSADMITPEDLAEEGVIDMTKQQFTLSEHQKVLAIGSVVKDIEIGDIIAVKAENFAQYKNQRTKMSAAVEGYEKVLVGYNLPFVETANGPVLLLHDSDIKYVVEGGLTDYVPPVEDEKPTEDIVFIDSKKELIVN